jgi:benzoyl-CoA reductase/2-hydroxyglutaryl-CoA dehydratase subunit BcrC/BadD/HgdB
MEVKIRMTTLSDYFNQLNIAQQDGYGPLAIKDLKENRQKNIVGVYCVFTPTELISAADAIPVSLCSKNGSTIPDAEKYLPRNLCPLIKSSYGYAVSDKCPYFHFADLIVGETTCDGKKKMYEYLNKLKPVHVMQLPQANSLKADFEFWHSEMLRLKSRLEKEFNLKITNERLVAEIKLKNTERNLLKELYQLQKLTPPPLFGSEILKLLNLSQFTFDKKIANLRTEKFIEKIKQCYRNEDKRISAVAPRILITGCPIGKATEKIIDLVEESGGVVVCFENCTGIKDKELLVAEDCDPIEALTEKYLKTPCSCMSPNDNRVKLLNKIIDEYQVDGVIDMVLQACHTYNVETFRIKEFVNNDKEIPYMSLETDYSSTDIGQLKTRISAFLEMLY